MNARRQNLPALSASLWNNLDVALLRLDKMGAIQVPVYLNAVAAR